MLRSLLSNLLRLLGKLLTLLGVFALLSRSRSILFIRKSFSGFFRKVSLSGSLLALSAGLAGFSSPIFFLPLLKRLLGLLECH
mgnify:CR=1 FL=1